MAKDAEVQKLSEVRVDAAGAWRERERTLISEVLQMIASAVVTTNCEKSAEAIVCDLEVVTLTAEILLLLSRSIPIDKCLVPHTRY